MGLLSLLLRVALVFGLLALVLWFVRRTEGGRRLGRADNPVQVLGSTRLGKGSTVTLVRIGNLAYALGVTEHSVTLITQTDLPAPNDPPVPSTVLMTSEGALDRPSAARRARVLVHATHLFGGRPAPICKKGFPVPAVAGDAAPPLTSGPAHARPSFAAALQQQLGLLVQRRPPELHRGDDAAAGRR